MSERSRRWWWLSLGFAIVASSALAARSRDGHDFVNNVWAPLRGLIHGYDPYDPAEVGYFERYDVPVVAGLYLPSALLLHAPLALLSRARSVDVMVVLNTALLWAGVLLLIRPRTARSVVAAAVFGSLIVLSAPAQDTIVLGQLSTWTFAGLALLVWSARHEQSAWFSALGVGLVALKPQSAVPIFAALVVVRDWRVVARAAVIVAATSLPGVVLFARAAGGVSGMVRAAGDNLALLEDLPTNDLANQNNIRIDALGVASHLGLPVANGISWALGAFVVSTALLILVVQAQRCRGRSALADPLVVTAVSVYVVFPLVHLSYDQVVLYVGPLSALALMLEHKADAQAKVLALGGLALMVVGCVFRAGFRARMIDTGLSALRVRQAWVTIPTVLGVAIVAIAFVVGRRADRARIRSTAMRAALPEY